VERQASRLRAIMALVMVNVLWGASFPIMKATNLIMEQRWMDYSGIPSPIGVKTFFQVQSACFFIAIRFVFALVLLGLLMSRLFRPMGVTQWRNGALTGIAFSAGFLFQVIALHEIPASRSGFLTSLAVVFTPLLMIVLERRFPRLPVVGGVLLALVGTAILTGVCEFGSPWGLRMTANATQRIGAGDMLTLLAALLFAIQIILIDSFGNQMSPAQLTPGMFLATFAAGSIAFTGMQAAPAAEGALGFWASLLADVPFLSLTVVMSLFCTVVAFYWMNKYQPCVSPAHAALIYTLEPICATAWAMFLPGLVSGLTALDYPSERPGMAILLGGLLVVSGNVLALWPPREVEPARRVVQA
jgi:drug/metabolite transporter (DMT)-like permease